MLMEDATYGKEKERKMFIDFTQYVTYTSGSKTRTAFRFRELEIDLRAVRTGNDIEIFKKIVVEITHFS